MRNFPPSRSLNSHLEWKRVPAATAGQRTSVYCNLLLLLSAFSLTFSPDVIAKATGITSKMGPNVSLSLSARPQVAELLEQYPNRVNKTVKICQRGFFLVYRLKLKLHGSRDVTDPCLSDMGRYKNLSNISHRDVR